MARILIIEDEVGLADAVRKGLQDERHRVDVRDDGETGLQAIVSGVYDLVVLDLMIPRIDGFEVCRRARVARIDLPILMLTARDTTRDVVRGLDAGANDYLTKPFDFEELLARVRALLRKSTGQTSRLRVGPLMLDMTDHRVYCGDAELELTAKEYQLLEIFMLRPGRILPKSQLIRTLWSADEGPTPNAVEVHLSSLRKKLERHRAESLIRTIRGRGYVIEEPSR